MIGDLSYKRVEFDLSDKSPIIYLDRKSTRLNSSHLGISYAVFCLKKKKERDGADIPEDAAATAAGGGGAAPLVRRGGIRQRRRGRPLGQSSESQARFGAHAADASV